MKTNELAAKAYESLIAEGRTILQNSGYRENENRYDQHPPDISYFRFRTEALNLIRRTCGDRSDHYTQLLELSAAKDSKNNSFYFSHCFGILEAAQRDFLAGMLFDMKALISAEVLGDFIDQAETLLAAKYHVPAASLTGAILEDSLRTLCVKNGVAIPESTKVDRLNADLARAGVYDKLVQKRITALADIRNNADHGHFEKFNFEDVEDMVKWVRRFTADYLN